MKKAVSSIIFYFFLILSILFFFSTNWIVKHFGLINMDSLLYHMTNSLEGTESSMIYSFIFGPILYTLIVLIIVIIIARHQYIYKPFISFQRKNKKKCFCLFKLKYIFVILLIILSLGYFNKTLNLFVYIQNMFNYSKFYDENYIDPKTVKVTFPDKKRNLIYIFVESLEYTFTSEEYGGAYEEDLIPNLINYTKIHTAFQNPLKTGFTTSRATGWTIASMVAQTAGINFIVPVNGNNYGKFGKFLPGAYTLGEILEKEGYKQVLMLGSDIHFANKDLYFITHGNYELKDYDYAKENKWIEDDYYEWWGYEDSKLFDFAQKELKELAKDSVPFNLTLLTSNTHHIGGYLENDCEEKYDEQLKNVVLCTDMQLYNFIEWIKKQDFYKNTTIVVVGDHLSMEPEFFNNLDNYQRTNYSLFINSSKEANNITDRLYNAMDMYPSTISSLGGNIEGDRLGLGTDLFSNTKTIYEEYGVQETEKELNRYSKYYTDYIFKGKK